MARVPIKSSMCSPVNGSGLVGIECTITKHVPGGALGSGEAAKIYLSETEGAQVGSNTVVTDSRGELTQGESTSWAEYWLAPGSYDYYWHGSGTKPFYVVKEMISAGPEGIGTEQIAGESVTEGKLANGAVSKGKLGEEAVTAAKVAKEAVTGPKLGSETVRLLAATAYSPLYPRSAGTEYEVSASRPAYVIAECLTGVNLVFYIGGVQSGEINGNAPISFIVPAGVKYKATGTASNYVAQSLLL